jgi:micrococcal nuclease
MYTYNAKIVKVIDGDTMDALVDLGFNMTIRIRLRAMNIDTPEIFKPNSEGEALHAVAAKNRAIELLNDKNVVIVTYKDPSAYNRYSSKITMPDGRDFSQVMIQEGFQKKNEY